MSRIVYAGGFGNGRSSVEGGGTALELHFEEVDTFTFSDFVRDPGRVREAAESVSLMTHSAGALAIASPEINPQQTYLLNPPLPRHIGGLIAASLVKTGRLYTPGLGLHTWQDLSVARAYSKSTAAEYIAHPGANFSQLPTISRFDAIDVAVSAKERIRPEITWTNHDVYFQPSPADWSRAAKAGIPMTMIQGEHDEVVLRSGAFLEQVLNKSESSNGV